MSSTSSISSPIVSASRPSQSIGVEGSSEIEPPCDGTSPSELTHRFASTPANCRLACVSCARVNFELPLPFCAHCEPQKPTVRGQLSPHSISVIVTEHSLLLTQPEATSVITSEYVPAPTLMQRVVAPVLQS